MSAASLRNHEQLKRKLRGYLLLKALDVELRPLGIPRVPLQVLDDFLEDLAAET